METPNHNSIEVIEGLGRQPEQRPDRFDYWKVAGEISKYKPPQEQRIKEIETHNLNPQIRGIELAMYALESAGKVRSRNEAEDSIDLAFMGELVGEPEQLDAIYASLPREKKRQLVSVIEEARQQVFLANAVQRKVEAAYELCASYGYTQQTELKKITARYTADRVGALKAIEAMDKKNLIGPVTRRLLESIIRTLIAEQEGLKLPRHLKSV